MERYGIWVDLDWMWVLNSRTSSVKAARARALSVAGKITARVYVVDHAAGVVRLVVAHELVAHAVAS